MARSGFAGQGCRRYTVLGVVDVDGMSGLRAGGFGIRVFPLPRSRSRCDDELGDEALGNREAIAEVDDAAREVPLEMVDHDPGFGTGRFGADE